jgi:hypothetical protein
MMVSDTPLRRMGSVELLELVNRGNNGLPYAESLFTVAFLLSVGMSFMISRKAR